MSAKPAPIRIIHYNDVYNVDVSDREPVGGAARFVTAINQTIKSHKGHTLVLFSGDAFSPAPLTDITKGEEIPPILNATKIDVACIGNHEFDNGIQVMKQRISETNFPWIMSNVFENNPSNPSQQRTPIGGIQLTHTITRGGFKFGFLALAAHEWLVTLDNVNLDDIVYDDFCEAATKIAQYLRHDENCDFVIALTHMRQPEDDRLALHHCDIDLILGGHDHVLSKKLINGRWVVKSGSDFKNFTTIDLVIKDDGKLAAEEPIHYAVTSEFTEDPDIARFVASKLKLLGDARHSLMATSTVDLDGRFVSIRTRETGLGNFVCDIMTRYMGGDIGLINSGSFRSDCIHQAGGVTLQTITTILPYKDQAVLTKCRGHELLAILENSVSQYPLLSGRFCQVSGISFSFDAKKPSGTRIDISSVRCKDRHGKMQILDQDAEYRCAMKTFIFDGKDGFATGDPASVLTTSSEHISDMISKQLKFLSSCDSEVPCMSPTLEDRIICINPDQELMRMYNC